MPTDQIGENRREWAKADFSELPIRFELGLEKVLVTKVAAYPESKKERYNKS